MIDDSHSSRQYYITEDANAHLAEGTAPYRWKQSGQCWGQVQLFLKGVWRDELVELAVIRPYQVSHFISDIPRGSLDFCPMLLSRNNPLSLQIAAPTVITAIAGRIVMTGRSRNTEVIFETSMDSQRPDMSFTAS
jgi:hypothetical protein